MNDETMGGGEARVVEAGRGLAWWTEAWALFMKNAGLWIVLSLVLLVLMIVISVVPILGGLAVSVLTPVFIGGWMLAARKVEQGDALEVGDLFLGFKEKRNPLLVLGVVFLLVGIAITVVIAVLGVGAAVGVVGSRGGASGILAAMGAGMLAVLVALVVGLLVAMAMWYAPALVVFRNMAPVDALKTSFAACLKNIIAQLLYAAISLVAAIVASIPFGLGWIVLVPVSLLTIYVSYQELFE